MLIANSESSMFEAIHQIVEIFGEDILLSYREIKVCPWVSIHLLHQHQIITIANALVIHIIVHFRLVLTFVLKHIEILRPDQGASSHQHVLAQPQAPCEVGVQDIMES